MRTRSTMSWAMALMILSVPVHAQDSVLVRVLRHLPNGAYVLQIRDQTMLAITEDEARRSLTCNAELRGALVESSAKDSLITAYGRAAAWSDTTVSRQRTLIAELDSLYRGYRTLAAGYKRLSGEPWLTFEGGLGATGSGHKPAILAGLGIRRVRVWGFLQEANAGGAVGVSLRLF